jgi:hypothetical protein
MWRQGLHCKDLILAQPRAGGAGLDAAADEALAACSTHTTSALPGRPRAVERRSALTNVDSYRQLSSRSAR